MRTTNVLRSLTDALEHFGVRNDGVLVVHSAIAGLSRQGVRAEEIIETLLEYMGDGTLLMPTMTWRTVTPEHPFWDEIKTPSDTGVLTEIFRTQYATARSIHPTHSVAGHGPNAKTLLARHQFDVNPVSGNSPYGLMRDYDAYILLLGVGLESCTAMHLPEETINPDLYLLPLDSAETYDCRDRRGTVHVVWTRRIHNLERDFPRFEAPLAEKRLLAKGKIADCPYMLISLRDLLREMFATLIANPRATLRGSPTM